MDTPLADAVRVLLNAYIGEHIRHIAGFNFGGKTGTPQKKSFWKTVFWLKDHARYLKRMQQI
jgi:hypothetical protein